MRCDKTETCAEELKQLTPQGPPREAREGGFLFFFLLFIGTEASLSIATSLSILSFSRSFTYYS